MSARHRIVAAAVLAVVVPWNTCTADPTDPRLDRLAKELDRVVKQHFPNVELTRSGSKVHFECKTRRFLIHEPTLKGEWQDAHEEIGPQPGGICGDIELVAGPYEGMAAVPQSFDKRYYILSLSAPYSKKLDQHLYIRLKHPRGVAKQFMTDFERLVGQFERYLAE